MKRSFVALSVTCLAALAGQALDPASAAACGGFFCDSGNPVNQRAERIIFSKGANGTVTAVIEILYEGPSEKFAWMLPVAGSPTVKVSSNSAFNALQGATNPLYTLNTTVEGTCKEESDRFGASASSDGFADGGAPEGEDGSQVTIVDRGAVGPYEYVIISVDPDAADEAATAVAWLQDNGFDVSDFGTDRLRPYLEGGMNLLTFRLAKGNDAGSIRPVMLEFGTGLPMIPLRPTAVAAVEDMGVMVWVLGAHRAIPANYFSLEINETILNWFNPNSNYNDVIIRAANEAGGQGFVTEFAGDAEPLADTVFSEFLAERWSAITTESWAGREWALVQELLGTFSGFDGASETLQAQLNVDAAQLQHLVDCSYCPEATPADADEWSCDAEGNWCADTAGVRRADIPGLDPSALIAEMTEKVVTPLRDTAALFRGQPYVTRLYTTMSPDEMTKDPAFDFNADLGDYSNTHTADRVIECSPTVFRQDATWRVTLENGWVVRGRGSDWPFDSNDDDLPANARILRVGTEGTGEVVEDNVSAIQSALTASNARFRRAPGLFEGGGFCATPAGGGPAAPGGLLVAVAGVALARAMRRRR